MSYKKQGFENEQLLTAEHLNHIEQGLEEHDLRFLELTKEMENYKNALTPTTKISEVTLTASGWVGTSSPYSQAVNIAGVTKNSQVDLTPNVNQLSIFWEKDLTFVTDNDNGVVTVYAIGQKPQNDYTIQVTLTEVLYE